MSEDALVNTGAAAWPSFAQAYVAVRRMQTKLHCWTLADGERRFDDLYNLVCDPAFLTIAWERVAKNKGARTPGVDRATVAQILTGDGVEAFLTQVRDQLRSGTFTPVPVRQVMIPKASGKLRKLGIPTVTDRVVQAALKLVLEPIFEADFQPCSYGFRPNRRAQDAIAEIQNGRADDQQAGRRIVTFDQFPPVLRCKKSSNLHFSLVTATVPAVRPGRQPGFPLRVAYPRAITTSPSLARSPGVQEPSALTHAIDQRNTSPDRPVMRREFLSRGSRYAYTVRPKDQNFTRGPVLQLLTMPGREFLRADTPRIGLRADRVAVQRAVVVDFLCHDPAIRQVEEVAPQLDSDFSSRRSHAVDPLQSPVDDRKAFRSVCIGTP